MAWQVELDEESQVVVLTYRGMATGPELIAAAEARIALGKESGVDSYIIDGTDLIAPKSTIMDVLDILKEVYEDKKMSRTSLLAVVKPTNPGSVWIAEFYENASILRGWRVKIFDDRDAALFWLQNYGERGEYS